MTNKKLFTQINILKTSVRKKNIDLFFKTLKNA